MWQANWLFSGIKGDGMKKTVKTVKKEYAIWIFVLLVLVFYLSWALAAPFDASPDESMRYQIVEFIVKHGTLPDGRDPEIRNANWGISYAFNPILPYMAGAVFAKVVQVFTDSFRATVIAARMVNVLLGCGTAWFTWKIGELLFRKKETGRLFAVLVCFLPGTCFLFSYINTDGLALFTTAWILYCWCRACKEGWTLKVCVQMGIAMGLCMLSYYNAYGYLLMSAVFFAGCMMKCGEQKWDWQQLLKKGCLMLGIVFLVAGWWFIRSGILYDGDFLGMKTSSIYAEKYAIDELKPSNRVLPVNMEMSVLDMIWWVPGEWQHNWLVTVLVSFVGTFGHLDIFMPYLWSKVYLIVFAVGILGNSWRLRREFCLTTEFVKRAGMKLLRDESVCIDQSFYLYGRPDAEKVGRGISRRKTPKELVNGMDLKKPVIVLDHEPRQLEELNQAGVDLDLCGHTHDGQLFPGNITIHLFWKNPYGYRKVGNAHQIVTSGVGLFGPNMRVGTKAEIVVVNVDFR